MKILLKDGLLLFLKKIALCNKTIRCCKTNLTQHSQTETYLSHIKSQNQSLNHNNNERISHKDKVKRAEIKLAAFFAEHNIAFCTANHLIKLLKDITIIKRYLYRT